MTGTSPRPPVTLSPRPTTIKLPRPIMNWTAHATGHWLGFCAVQAGLAVQAIIGAVRNLGRYPDRDLLPWIWFNNIDRQIGVRALQQLEEGPSAKKNEKVCLTQELC